MSDLLEVRVLGAPTVAAEAVVRLAEVLDLDRERGPYPSCKAPELVRYYLTGRLRPDRALLARRARGRRRGCCPAGRGAGPGPRARPLSQPQGP